MFGSGFGVWEIFPGSQDTRKTSCPVRPGLQVNIQNQIPNISITEVYSSLQPGKLLNSVISGPYKNKSAANNAKEKITIEGFEPTLRTRCEQK